MQNLPNGWIDARNAFYRMETKVNIAGVDYEEKQITELRTKAAMYSRDTISIGGCVAKEIDLTIVPQGDIPRMAEIRVFVRPVAEGVDAEWLQKGVYFIDTRQKDYATGRLIIHGYDTMLKAEQIFTDGSDEGDWPRTMPQIVEEIAERMGVALDPRTVLNEAYTAEYPAEYTMREILGYIAVAHAANWVITDVGELRLVPLVTQNVVFDVGMEAASLDTSPAFSRFTGVRVWVDDEKALFSGDDTGRVLEADCPWATQAVVDGILQSVLGYAYQPFKASGAVLDPVAELGDGVTVAGISSVLASINTSFNSLCAADIEAPADEEIDHEYPYVDPATRNIDRKIAQNRSLIEKTDEKIMLEVESIDGRLTSVEQTAGQVQVSIKDKNGSLVTTIDTDSWEAIRRNLAGDATSGFWFDFEDGQFVFDGTGEFRSRDGLSYITIEGNELVLYSKRDGTALDKLRIGFVTGMNPAGTDEVDYPYILLGNTGNVGGGGLVKKFWNGLFIGNSYSKNTGGNFVPTNKDNGFFINISTGKSYAVQDGIMYDMIARADGSVALTTQEIGHNEEILADCMPVYVTQEQYDEMVATGEYNPVTPYFIRREV